MSGLVNHGRDNDNPKPFMLDEGSYKETKYLIRLNEDWGHEALTLNISMSNLVPELSSSVLSSK